MLEVLEDELQPAVKRSKAIASPAYDPLYAGMVPRCDSSGFIVVMVFPLILHTRLIIVH